MDKRSAESLAAAERHFKRAIELAPEYALAYVGLAETYDLQIAYGSLLWEESLELRQPLVDRALELAPLSGEAHLARASLLFHQQLKTGQENSSAIDEEILRAIELSPNSTETLRWYSGLLYEQGRHEEALAQLHAAAELDPMSQVIQTDIAAATWDLGRAEEAMRLIRQNIERTPEFPDNYERMANYLWQLGHLGEAQRWRGEALGRNPDSFKWWRECLGLLDLGDERSAEDCANRLGEAYPDKVITDVTWAALSDFRNERSTAIAILESLSERLLGWPAYSRWLADLIASEGDIDRARSLMASAFPELLEGDIEIRADWYHMLAAVVFAALLDANGETPARDRLLLALEDRIDTMHRIHGVGYGMLDVYIHTMRGDRGLAIASMREAIDMGWRTGQWLSWWMLRQDWKLSLLHEDPAFLAMMDELEADIAAQRRWFEENRDKPLF